MTTSRHQDTIPPVLVTGGAGYIGSTLVRLLLKQHIPVRVVDNLTFGGEALLGVMGDDDFELVVGDICHADTLDRALDGVQSVVHLAAIVGDPACAQQPKRAIQVNRDASALLFEKAVAHGIHRFVFVSTCSNYGTMETTSDYVDETSPLKPVSLYAELKVECEQLLLSATNTACAPVILRFATAYGLSARPRFDLTVNEFTRELVLNRPLEIYGEQFWRPYCHVADLARACVLALTTARDAVAFEAFNVGDTKENYTKKNLVELILAELPERKRNVSYVHRDEDPRDYRVNCDKIQSRLGFTITRQVAGGIREIIHAINSGLIPDPDNPRYRNVGNGQFIGIDR